jgi:dTDP-4-amino-4,6-dideoxygalactose transaminase
MGVDEEAYVGQVYASNWLFTVGPNITAFEEEFEDWVKLPAVALSGELLPFTWD